MCSLTLCFARSSVCVSLCSNKPNNAHRANDPQEGQADHEDHAQNRQHPRRFERAHGPQRHVEHRGGKRNLVADRVDVPQVQQEEQGTENDANNVARLNCEDHHSAADDQTKDLRGRGAKQASREQKSVSIAEIKCEARVKRSFCGVAPVSALVDPGCLLHERCCGQAKRMRRAVELLPLTDQCDPNQCNSMILHQPEPECRL